MYFEKSWKIGKIIIIDTEWWNMGIYYTVLTKHVWNWNFHNKMLKNLTSYWIIHVSLFFFFLKKLITLHFYVWVVSKNLSLKSMALKSERIFYLSHTYYCPGWKFNQFKCTCKILHLIFFKCLPYTSDNFWNNFAYFP